MNTLPVRSGGPTIVSGATTPSEGRPEGAPLASPPLPERTPSKDEEDNLYDDVPCTD